MIDTTFLTTQVDEEAPVVEQGTTYLTRTQVEYYVTICVMCDNHTTNAVCDECKDKLLN